MTGRSRAKRRPKPAGIGLPITAAELAAVNQDAAMAAEQERGAIVQEAVAAAQQRRERQAHDPQG